MTFLVPSLLALGLAVAVPLILHMLQRHQGRRVMFPALRYLRRAERDHATRIRIRQLLLLALRVLAILLVAAAAARPLIHGIGDGHAPTSVVVILDNSMSTAAIAGDRRVLDDLKDAALETLAAAGPDDRFWLIRAGSPWEPALTGDPAGLAAAVRRTEPAGGAADLAGVVERAASILAGEPEDRAREVQLLSDLQASNLEPGAVGAPVAVGALGTAPTSAAASGGADPAVRVLAPSTAVPSNRAVVDVSVGGGLPPRAGERSTVAVTVLAAPPTDGVEAAAGGDTVAVRLVVEGSVRGAARAEPGATVVLPFPTRGPGLVAGYAEMDPDALRADDRRYFVVEIAPPTGLAVAASRPFVDEAVSVLEDAGRVRRLSLTTAPVVLAPGGLGADQVRRGAAVVVLPPASALELPAANQRLASAGIPWRFAAPRAGDARLDTTGMGLASSLSEIRLRQVYALEAEEAGDSVLLRVYTGEPWAVTGQTPGGGRYVLLASPLTVAGGTIPTSAAMVPLMDRAVSVWAAGSTDPREFEPGATVTVAGDRVIGPEVDDSVAAGSVYRLERPGIYRVLRADDTVAAYAVNPPAHESRLERLSSNDVMARLPGREVRVASPGDWAGAIFHQRLGREIDGWLIAALLALLVVEMAVAASGRSRPRKPAPGGIGPGPDEAPVTGRAR